MVLVRLFFTFLVQVFSDAIETVLDDKFTLAHEVVGTEITFTFKCDYGWCGIALGNGMTESDILVVLYPQNGSPSLIDAWSLTTVKPPEDSGNGGTNNLSGLLCTSGSARFECSFKRSLSTGDSLDTTIIKDVAMSYSYAYLVGATSFGQHSKRARAGSITFSETAPVSTSDIVEIILDDKFTLVYQLLGTEIGFTFKCDYGWCGIALGSGMTESDILVVLYPQNGSPSLIDAWSQTTIQPPEDSTNGGANNLSGLLCTSGSTRFECFFKRSLNTGDSLDKTIIKDVAMSYSYAYLVGATSFAYHSKRASAGPITFSETAPVIDDGDTGEDTGGDTGENEESSSESNEYKLDSSFTLVAKISGDEITFTYECEFGWCGLAFGDKMTKSDILVVLYPQNGSPSLIDGWSETTVKPPEDSTLGGKASLSSLSCTSDSTKFTCSFKRKLNTEDSFDTVIAKDVALSYSYAYLKGVTNFGQHSKRASGTITFSETAEGASLVVDDKDTIDTHALYMTITWYYLAPIGIVFARYFKWWSLGTLIHVLLLGVVVVIGAGSPLLIYLDEENVYATFPEEILTHSRIGLTLAALVVAEALFGTLTLLSINFLKIDGITAMLRRMHRILGWSMLLFALYNRVLGLYLRDEEWEIVFPIVLLGVLLLFEIRHRITFWVRSLNFRIIRINAMKYTEVAERIKAGDQLVFHENYVLNVKLFKFTHPGGTFLLKKAIGEDIGKYLYGCSSYGEAMLPYQHSNQAFDMIEHLAVGKLSPLEGFFVGKDAEMNEKPWGIIFKEEIAESTILLTLSSPDFVLSSKPEGFSWIGKHFRVAMSRYGVSRYYSIFFCNLAEWEQSLGLETAGDSENRQVGCVQFIMKLYSTGELTPQINNLETGGELILSGPYGPGLALPASPDGHYLGFAGGTGLVPFLDFIHYIWENRESELLFVLTLYISFTNDKCSFLRELIDKAAEASKGKIQVIWMIRETRTEQPAKVIEGLKEVNPKQVWICGPSGFNRFVYDILTSGKTRISKDRITLM